MWTDVNATRAAQSSPQGTVVLGGMTIELAATIDSARGFVGDGRAAELVWRAPKLVLGSGGSSLAAWPRAESG